MKFNSTIKNFTLGDLVEFPGNPNVMPAKQFDKIIKQMSRDGWIGEPATVWFCKRDNKNYILSGNHRVRAAIDAKIIKARCVLIDDEKFKWSHAKKYNLAYNNKGEFDLDLLNDFVLDIGMTDIDALALDTGLDENYLTCLFDSFNAGETEADDEVPEKVPAITKLGDLWELDGHRVLCGDSTDVRCVEKLMDGKKADMVLTDPPYNLASETGLIGATAPTQKKTYEKLKNSEWDKNFNIKKFLVTLKNITQNNCVYYICTSQFLISDIWEWMRKELKFNGYVVWCKPNPAPCLHKKHWTWSTELIAYGTNGNHICNFPSEGHALNHWLINSGIHTEDHPTQKPIAIPEKAILFSSKKNYIIYDGFVGSGTTLIACEKTNRICYGIEIDPHYCDVIVRRYIDWMIKNNKEINIKRNSKKFNTSRMLNGSQTK